MPRDAQAEPLPADQVFSFRGCEVRHARLGQGPALLFLHNAGASSTIWRYLAPALASRREVFALDWPGYGASLEPRLGFELAEAVELLDALITERKLDRVDIIGNCMGSAIALQFAAAHPERVRSLTLFNPLSASTFLSGSIAGVRWIEDHAPFVFDALGACLSRVPVPASVARELVRLQLGPARRKTDLSNDAALLRCYRRPTQPLALRHVLRDMHSFGAIDRLVPGPDFPPICTIWGLENRILSPSAGRALNRTLAPARQEWLADCGHLPMLERPELCLEIITSFLEGSARGAHSTVVTPSPPVGSVP